MKTSELDYDLPEDLIAQKPCEKRDASRLLVLDRQEGSMCEDVFRNLATYLRRGDCLVLNDTRVIRARLRGQKVTGGNIEILLLREASPGTWEALVRPSARVKAGARVQIADDFEAWVEEALPDGRRRVRFDVPDILDHLERVGEMPLPPYIKRPRPDEAGRAEALRARDGVRYQTVYARVPGAIAAPTAGLHFTDEVFESLARAGVRRSTLTLHVGYGTFRPIIAENVEDHTVEPEEFEFPEGAAALLNSVRAEGCRVVAVGTTSTRVLETQYQDGAFRPGRGITDQYIYPPYTFRAVDALQTNFHLPRSSLLALVCAFAGTDFVLEAYRYAIQKRFRFYSYGDAMLIL